MNPSAPNDLPTTVVIFGASGDLTHRKLIPALFNQYRKGRTPPGLSIVGSSRTEYAHEAFRQRMQQGMQELAGVVPEAESWEAFSQRLWYLPGDATEPKDIGGLVSFLEDLEGGAGNRLYYLATAPRFFPLIIDQLGKAEMAADGAGWRRIVIEKPFGRDLASALELNHAVHQVFDEHQVYRIDHYLGKETAQNILYFRFLNTIFEPIWNRNFIDHVQITVAESVDVEHRAGYYDQAGVVRDMFQNHFSHLLTLVAMEPPAASDADAVRNEKVKVLQAVRPLNVQDSVRAQYRSYCETEGVAQDSQTPTYAAIKLLVDNWRWQGVPFYLRSGKALHEKSSEIVVVFKEPPHVMFDLPQDYQLTSNFLSICIQPDEGIHLRFETKVPDSLAETRSVDMEFHYRDSFGDRVIPDAYERLLVDALNGDASLFTRGDEIELAWKLFDPLLEAWESSAEAPPLVTYERGSWGPTEADEFLAREGRVWWMGCADH